MKPLELLQAQHEVMYYCKLSPRNHTVMFRKEFCPRFSLKQKQKKSFNQSLVRPKPIKGWGNELLSASPLRAERRNLLILIEAWSRRPHRDGHRNGFSPGKKKRTSCEKALVRNGTQKERQRPKERKQDLGKCEHRLLIEKWKRCSKEMTLIVCDGAGGGVSRCSFVNMKYNTVNILSIKVNTDLFISLKHRGEPHVLLYYWTCDGHVKIVNVD